MTPYKFYDWFVTLVESFPLVPLMVGLVKWKKLSKGIKFFLGFLFTDFLLNKIGDYYFNQNLNNLFLHYYYSFSQSFFILLTLWYFFDEKKEKKIITLLLLLSWICLIIDYFFISKTDYNYFSGPVVAIVICVVSAYYFSKRIVYKNENSKTTSSTNLKISLVITVQFFIKLLDAFLEKYVMESQNNAFAWFQIKDIYYYFMLLCFLIYTYTLYKIEIYET